MFKDLQTYQASGLFSMSHIVAFAICFAIIAICVYLSLEITKKEIKTIYIFFAVCMLLMILIDYIWNIARGYTQIENLIPISIITLFIIALCLSLCKKEKLAYISKVFLTYVGIGFGAVMLVLTFPSFTNYPVFHFKCLFELCCYSAMLYTGIMMLVLKEVKICAKTFKIALFIIADVLVDCLILNMIFNVNFLNLMSPEGLGLNFLTNLHMFNGGIYSILAFAFYFSPIVLAYITCKTIYFVMNKYNK